MTNSTQLCSPGYKHNKFQKKSRFRKFQRFIKKLRKVVKRK